MKYQNLAHFLLATCLTSQCLAGLVDFQSPYTIGAFSATPVSLTANRPFDGQQGWSRSTSNHTGQVLTSTSSGSYTGGQALAGSSTAATAETYIGAKAVGAFGAYAFDFRYYAVEIGVGGWNDDDADALFDQSEAEYMPGIVATSANTYAFGLRAAGFAGAGGTFNGRFSSGTSGVDGNWYRMTVTPDHANLTVTLAVFNLTTNTAVTLATSTFTLTAGEFGVNPTGYEGITARVSSKLNTVGALDNIQTYPPGSFASWAAGKGLSGNADADADSDGLADAVEYVLGSDPKLANASALGIPATGGSFVITFPRDDASETPDVSLLVEVGTNLSTWPKVYAVGADTASSTAGVSVTENAGSAPDTITVTIPQNTETQQFARIKVVVTQ